jgi:uncharacterized protein (DUF3084 family)
MTSTPLDNELLQLKNSLTKLIIKESDPDKVKKLTELQTDLLNMIRRLVDKNVQKATKEYANARQDVEQANAEVLKAIQDLAKVAKTIDTIAKVVEVLGKLAAAAV